MDVGEDRISELPESLILRILSFLPTKRAVSTTVLSKRWNNLWISLPDLDFRQRRTITYNPASETNIKQLYEKKNRIMDLLDKVLSSSNTTTIHKLCADLSDAHFDENRVRDWITAFITLRVEALILDMRFSVPQDLFTCESLTMLDLNFGRHHVRLDFPKSISLPRLKVLRLLGVEFEDTASTRQLFSNCSVLEELTLCECTGKDGISFSAPNLKYFTVELSENLKVDIDAPNLASIMFWGWRPRSFPVGSFPSLVKAKFIYSEDGETITLDYLSNFVRMYSNIKLLKASSDYIQIFDIANVSSTSFPTFDNLMHLEVRYSDFGYPSISSLFNFLHISPNLESLIVNRVRCTRKLNRYELTLNTTPRCLLLRLKSIAFRFSSKKLAPKKMELVKLFLKHAQVLDQLVVIISRSAYSSSEVINELQSFPRASTHCNFQVSKTKPTCPNNTQAMTSL